MAILGRAGITSAISQPKKGVCPGKAEDRRLHIANSQCNISDSSKRSVSNTGNGQVSDRSKSSVSGR